MLYKNALDTSAYDWFASSARIVQEHTLRAMLAAAQSCSQALAQNTAKVQQQGVDRLLAANQKAAGIMGEAWIRMLTPR